MLVSRITQRSRCDFWGLFQCEHCGSISKGRGYSDGYYHENVLPFCECPACGLQGIKGEVKTSYDGFELVEKKELPEGYEPPERYYSGEPEEG